jgi:hypothetical protein
MRGTDGEAVLQYSEVSVTKLAGLPKGKKILPIVLRFLLMFD